MDDLLIVILVIIWLVLIIGGPTGYLIWQINRDEDAFRRERLVKGLVGWFIGIGVSVLLFLILPNIIINEETNPAGFKQSLPTVQFFLLLILPPLCAGLGFLSSAFVTSRIQQNEGMYEEEYQEEKPNKEKPAPDNDDPLRA
jgi:hypothetical protein